MQKIYTYHRVATIRIHYKITYLHLVVNSESHFQWVRQFSIKRSLQMALTAAIRNNGSKQKVIKIKTGKLFLRT